jgi:hypothetical protein
MLRSLSGLLLASATSLSVGCAGAETQDVLSRDTSGQAATSSSGNASSSGNGSSSGDTTSGGTSGDTSSGSPIGTCNQEKEPNDDRSEANRLAPALCGTVSSEDRRDFLTFRLQASTRRLALRFSGQVRLRVEVGNEKIELTTADSQTPVPFVMNQDYSIEVEPLIDLSGEIPWQVKVEEKDK